MKPINCVCCGAISWGKSRYLNKASVCKYCRKKINNLIKKGIDLDIIWNETRKWRKEHDERQKKYKNRSGTLPKNVGMEIQTISR